MKKVIFILALAVAASCGGSKKEQTGMAHKTLKNIEIQKVKTAAVTYSETFSATVIPDKTIMLSPKVVGYIKKIYAKAGDRVKKGQLLAIIDRSDIEPDVKKAKAGLSEIKHALEEIKQAEAEVNEHIKSAKANLELARKTYERFKKLLQGEAVSKQRFDEVEAKYKSALAEYTAVTKKLDQIKAKKKQLEDKREQILADLSKASAYLSYTYLKSPVNGFVMRKLVDEGNLVSPQTPVFEIGSNRLSVYGYLDEKYYPQLKVGNWLKVKIDGRIYSARISEIDMAANPVTHKIKVKAQLPSEATAIPGKYAEIVVESAEQVEKLLVPESSIYTVGALEYVFVIDKNKTAHLRLVKTGKKINGYVEVLSGIHKGEQIAVSGVSKLYDGAKVGE